MLAVFMGINTGGLSPGVERKVKEREPKGNAICGKAGKIWVPSV